MIWTDERINEAKRHGDMFQDREIAVSYMATALYEMRDEYEVERQALSVELSAKDVEIARLMDSLEQTRTHIKRQDVKVAELARERDEYKEVAAANAAINRQCKERIEELEADLLAASPQLAASEMWK